MTGQQVLAQVTGPSPLERPATAINTTGSPLPSYCKQNYQAVKVIFEVSDSSKLFHNIASCSMEHF